MNRSNAFFKNVFQDIKSEIKDNSAFLFLLLLLISIPLPVAINNLVFGLLLISVFLNKEKINIKTNQLLFLPILLFLLMTLSYFWSIDSNITLVAIPKECALLLLPLAFFKTKITSIQKEILLKYFSSSMVVLVLFFIIRALIRYSINQDSRAFFYHGEDNDDYGLVPKVLNAIHISVFVAIAFFYFYTKELKSKTEVFLCILLGGFIVLLSSKNVIFVIVILMLIHFFFYSKSSHKMRLRNLIIFIGCIILAFSFSEIKKQFQKEFRENSPNSISPNVANNTKKEVHNISIYEAWNNETFSPNDYFPGTAFRVYQLRMFLELINEDAIFIKGYGLNTSNKKLIEKEKKYNLYNGYGSYNFHNQYIQNFAELGVVGFLLLVIILVLSLKNAINNKDFMHFSFTILMISLFLTESFLWRQRGVVFFTLLYCIFNSINHKESINIETK